MEYTVYREHTKDIETLKLDIFPHHYSQPL